MNNYLLVCGIGNENEGRGNWLYWHYEKFGDAIFIDDKYRIFTAWFWYILACTLAAYVRASAHVNGSKAHNLLNPAKNVCINWAGALPMLNSEFMVCK